MGDKIPSKIMIRFLCLVAIFTILALGVSDTLASETSEVPVILANDASSKPPNFSASNTSAGIRITMTGLAGDPGDYSRLKEKKDKG